MQTTLTNEGIVWKFNPPGAPHMGGCWERLIRSIKTSLRVTLKERVPTQEVLYTLLIEAESILNNRPLTYLSLDHKDDPPLTPNHFLLGRPDAIAAPGSFTNSKWCTRKHWKTAQRLTDHFWARWVKEYMPVLTRRVKWCQQVDPVKLGAIVLLVDPTFPRNQWLKGVVKTLYPGRDGQVRVVDVETVFGTFRRPVCKICVLDIENYGV